MRGTSESSAGRRVRIAENFVARISAGVVTCVVAVAANCLNTVPASSAEVPRIGFLAWDACDIAGYAAGSGEYGAMVHALTEIGHVPGKTIALDCRSAGRTDTGFLAAARDLVAAAPDVIVAMSQPAGQAAHDATSAIPIVSIVSGDPVAAGLAKSLARPGGNLTGVSYYATELTAKRLELLQEMIPGIARVGVLANPDVGYLPFEEDTRRAAGALGIEVSIQQLREPGGLSAAFDRMIADNVEAVFVLPDVMLANAADSIADLALKNRLPVMAWGTWFTKLGGLMAYSADYKSFFPHLAVYVDRILKGAKPGDLPIEQPTTFILSINMKTAATLGITPPESILLAADMVFE